MHKLINVFPNLTPYTKLSNRPNGKANITKLLEESIKENLGDLDLGKDSLHR